MSCDSVHCTICVFRPPSHVVYSSIICCFVHGSTDQLRILTAIPNILGTKRIVGQPLSFFLSVPVMSGKPWKILIAKFEAFTYSIVADEDYGKQSRSLLEVTSSKKCSKSTQQFLRTKQPRQSYAQFVKFIARELSSWSTIG